MGGGVGGVGCECVVVCVGCGLRWVCVVVSVGVACVGMVLVEDVDWVVWCGV